MENLQDQIQKNQIQKDQIKEYQNQEDQITKQQIKENNIQKDKIQVYQIQKDIIQNDFSLDVDSNILKQEEYDFIYQELVQYKEKKVSLKLLYRGSRDSFRAETFHKLCDNKGESLTLIENEFKKRFGGRTTQSWISDYIANNQPIHDHYAFLFSLDLKKSYKINENGKEYAICGWIGRGPIFGGNPNISIFDLCNEHNKNITDIDGQFYEGDPNNPYQISGQKKFKVTEIEVYSIQYS